MVRSAQSSRPPRMKRAEEHPFDLEITHGSGTREYIVTVVRSPAGEAHEVVHFPFADDEMQDQLTNFRLALLSSDDWPHTTFSQKERGVQELGQRLFDTFITGQVRNRYDESQGLIATQPEAHLHLRLALKAQELDPLPWELLYDPRKSTYVCLSKYTTMTRSLDSLEDNSPFEGGPPLYILGMIANPTDQDPLDIEGERSLLREALLGLRWRGLVRLTWLKKQTWEELQQALARDSWDIFHFIGYGNVDVTTGEGQLAFATEQGQTHWVPASQVAGLLATHRSLRLAVLDANEGARGQERDLFSSTALTFLRQGLPAIVTQQYKIPHEMSAEFTRVLYQALARKVPLDVAVTRARHAITHTLAFGTWACYNKAPGGVLFTRSKTRKEKRSRLRRVSWGKAFRVAAPCFLFVFCVLFFLSVLFNSQWSTILTAILGIISLVATALPFFIRLPQPGQIHLSGVLQKPLRWFKGLWPTHRQDRRWFLKGCATGIGTLVVSAGVFVGLIDLLIQIGNATSEGNFPPYTPPETTPLPTPEGSVVNTYYGHLENVYAVAWSPDGQYIASAGADNTVQVWRSAQGFPENKVTTYPGHSDAVNALAWSPDGSRIASASDDQTVQVWEVGNNSPVFIYRGHSAQVKAVAWSSDGKRITSGGVDQTVQVIDASTGRRLQIYRGHRDTINAVAWALDNKRVASASGSLSYVDNTVHVWDIESKTPAVIYKGHHEAVNALSWSHDRPGSRIASASSDSDTTIEQWNALTGHTLLTKSELGGANAVAWSPDDRRIASAGGRADYSIRVWDAKSGGNEVYFTGHDDRVNAIAWSPNGQYIASASDDHTVNVWQAS